MRYPNEVEQRSEKLRKQKEEIKKIKVEIT